MRLGLSLGLSLRLTLREPVGLDLVIRADRLVRHVLSSLSMRSIPEHSAHKTGVAWEIFPRWLHFRNRE